MEIYIALGKRSLPFFISLLNDADGEMRTFRSVMLGTRQDRGDMPSLIVLGCRKMREALSFLVELSTDRDMDDVARKALARIGR